MGLDSWQLKTVFSYASKSAHHIHIDLVLYIILSSFDREKHFVNVFIVMVYILYDVLNT